MKVIKNKGISKVFAYLFSMTMASALLVGNVQAATLDSSTQCSANNAINGIAVGDVTGNAGGASDCWGTFDGNDPGPSGDGFEVTMNGGTMQFDFVAKQNISDGNLGALEGDDIGLVIAGLDSGTWSFDSNIFDPEAFIIVLKAANSPGYAAWLFEGTDAASVSGTWDVAWTTGGGPNPSNPNLSHLSVYAKDGGGDPPSDPVPEPGMVLLFGFGLAAFGFARRHQKA